MIRLTVSAHVVVTIIIGILAACVVSIPARAGDSEPADALPIRLMMQDLIYFLDSHDYAGRVSWNEHLVLAYSLAADREPDLPEFFNLKKLQEYYGLSRSAVLSIALRGNEMRPSWQQCRTFLSRVNMSDFQVDQKIQERARQLAAAPHREAIEKIPQRSKTPLIDDYGNQQPSSETIVPFEQYNTYFGYLHAHSTISDGEGSPERAYRKARDEGGLDFFALTDHGYAFNLWPWENEWEEMVAAAEDAYQPGIYATLWGFEWTSLIYGHINVLNSSGYTDLFSEISLSDIYNWIANRPECFARYNHPGDYDDTGSEFAHLALYTGAVEQMIGIETWNSNDAFDRYYYGGSWSSSVYSYWDAGNRNGWYLGALGGQDNHNEDWGTRNEFRTAVLARVLTREDIVEAYMNRRFYTSEDKDLYLNFRCRGYPMGSQLSDVSRVFEIEARDASGDTFREVRLYRNGVLLRSEPVSGNEIHIFLDEYSGYTDSAYYYVVVQQNDDNDGNGRNDEAISSPIFVTSTMCEGDFEPADGDVDGSDLAILIGSGAIDIGVFAEDFGRENCPTF
jgi:hypothetical protein